MDLNNYEPKMGHTLFLSCNSRMVKLFVIEEEKTELVVEIDV